VTPLGFCGSIDLYMTFKTFVTSVAVAATLLGPVFAFAQETAPVTPIETVAVATPVVIDPTVQMQNELTDLKTREADPTTGFVARFFMRIKIKELENKLNIATALK
jgi:hypothetical protein